MIQISWPDFEKVELRVGTVLRAEEFPEAKKPAYKLFIDFGPEIGHKQTSVQITKVYKLEDLSGMQVVAVVNFPPKQIGPFRSEVLVTGFERAPGEVVLITPTEKVPNGSKLF